MLVMALACLVLAGCASQPRVATPLTEKERARAEAAIEEFRADDRLVEYFEQAKVIAIYPNIVRAATGFGGAYGTGYVYREGLWVGQSRVWQLNAGANVGLQAYNQVIFFKTEAAFSRFAEGTYEFAGQANAAFVLWGGGATPAFNEDVAVFTRLNGGLLLEASVGAHRYTFREYPATP